MSEAKIGFDRKIKLDWLDAAAWQMSSEWDVSKLRSYLDELIQTDHPTTEARKKTITVITRIWGTVKDEHRQLAREALTMLPDLHPEHRLWLHWGMTLVAHPYFRDIAAIIGELSAIQETVTFGQILRRLMEKWGDRSTIRRTCQYVVRTMVLWEALMDTGKPGVYSFPAKRTASRSLQLWLLEAVVAAESSQSIHFGKLLKMPSAFPFKLDISLAELRKSERLEVYRQGLDMEMVSLKE